MLMGRRIAVLPFYDLSDLQTTTELGRLAGEELAAALHFRNFHLAEIRTDDQIILARWVGESYLTRTGPERELRVVAAPVDALREKHNLGGLVVGTYAVLPDRSNGSLERRLLDGRVSLNARLLDPHHRRWSLAMGSKKISIDRTVEALLRRRRRSAGGPAHRRDQGQGDIDHVQDLGAVLLWVPSSLCCWAAPRSIPLFWARAGPSSAAPRARSPGRSIPVPAIPWRRSRATPGTR